MQTELAIQSSPLFPKFWGIGDCFIFIVSLAFIFQVRHKSFPSITLSCVKSVHRSSLSNQSLARSLLARELGNTKWELPILTRMTQNRIDNEFSGIITFVDALRNALKAVNWDDIDVAVGDIIVNILDNGDSNQVFVVTPKKKLQRECFVTRGGMEMLLKLFEPPLVSQSDGRNIPADEVRLRSELWNEILVILREVCFAIPSLSDKTFKTEHMVFLFTLLSHQSLFDNAMNLLEEILASREDTFSLSTVPNFYSLIGRFSARQLAHFCRVLSLVLFEPEDRQVMDGTHVMHSTELLQLRRNRMAKNSCGVVERNQGLVSSVIWKDLPACVTSISRRNDLFNDSYILSSSLALLWDVYPTLTILLKQPTCIHSSDYGHAGHAGAAGAGHAHRQLRP